MSKRNRNRFYLRSSRVGQLLVPSQKEGRRTYDQPTGLLVYRFLLGQLRAASTMHPECDQWNATDLIFHSCVPNTVCKFAHGMHICVIFFVPSCTGSLQNWQQLVLDPFKTSEVELMWALAVIHGQNILEQDHPPLGFVLIPYGAVLYFEPAQPLKDRFNVSLYPLWFLLMCQPMSWSACGLLHLAKFQKCIERCLCSTNHPSASRAKTLRRNLQPTARPGR